MSHKAISLSQENKAARDTSMANRRRSEPPRYCVCARPIPGFRVLGKVPCKRCGRFQA